MNRKTEGLLSFMNYATSVSLIKPAPIEKIGLREVYSILKEFLAENLRGEYHDTDTQRHQFMVNEALALRRKLRFIKASYSS